MMSEMLVSFKNPEEILNFVNTVAKYPYDMDMKRGRFVVDAKSLSLIHISEPTRPY